MILDMWRAEDIFLNDEGIIIFTMNGCLLVYHYMHSIFSALKLPVYIFSVAKKSVLILY